MSSVLYMFLVLYFAVSVSYYFVQFLNTKFNWWSTPRRIIKVETPSAEKFKEMSNRFYVTNFIGLGLAFLILVMIVVLMWILFTMKSYSIALLEKRLPSISPVATTIGVSSWFGERVHPLYHSEKFHNGLDFRAGYGETIKASGDGFVVSNDYGAGAGNFIVLYHGTFNGRKIYSKYFHLGRHNFVKEGQYVKKGQEIGEVGNTGLIDGIHLHYEVVVDNVNWNPARFVKAYNKQYDAMATNFIGNGINSLAKKENKTNLKLASL